MGGVVRLEGYVMVIFLRQSNVPAGIEHADQVCLFRIKRIHPLLIFPDPPITLDYSGQNDGLVFGHDRFVNAMNERKYPLYFYWGAGWSCE